MMASASPAAAITHTRPVSDDVAKPTAAPVAEAESYAEREQQTPAAAAYVGGRSGVYIGGGALVVVLIILVVILLI
ncbi:MAG: hypothetical protein H0T89_36480 [Deltaproteobacteria bacterium]|nr:hypothetical protein [Deltaproteobacteria bacterium]MDQ3295169.1 hypothetical protein [Myxococcota bacterium]